MWCLCVSLPSFSRWYEKVCPWIYRLWFRRLTNTHMHALQNICFKMFNCCIWLSNSTETNAMSTSKEPPRKKNRTFLERYTEYNDEADAWDSSQGGWTAQLPAQPAVMIARDIHFCRKVRGSPPVTFSQIFFHNFRTFCKILSKFSWMWWSQ